MTNAGRISLDLKGLSSHEASDRLRRFGENIVATRKKLRPIVAFFEKFQSPLILILIFASGISFFIGEKTNAVILVSMILISVVLDFVNTYRSEKSIEKLISKVVTTATVLRDGREQEINLKYVVPGDIVVLSAGDVVPADCRILESKDFFINQSILTGESLPVEKTADQNKTLGETTPDATHLIFMGTSVVTGFATGEVIKTGSQTEFGKIADRLSAEDQETDFDRNIRSFSAFIMKITIVLVLLVFFANAFLGKGILPSFIFAVAIAIGLTPELLPVILSVSLSRGAIRMSKKDVVVKHLPAIQNFGRMDVLCTDKTGTLTENKITVVKYVDSRGNSSEEVLRLAYFSSYFHTGVPNPLDQAVKDYKKLDTKNVEKVDEIPFDFERRRDSMVIKIEGRRVLITKGAPEAVFGICKTLALGGKNVVFGPKAKSEAEAEFKRLSQDGFKVLAVATRSIEKEIEVYEKQEESQMCLRGFLAFMDPPKPSVLEAIKDLEDLGVEIKILTGDSELLTEKICREIKLKTRGASITGTELDKLNERELEQVVDKTTIFARITPDQKEKIILSLQKIGKVVGYLGDGINDAPALKVADVGISVANAVDVAKETADLILLKKSLHALKDGVIEGRKTFQNTLKYLMVGLSSNFGNMFSMTAASAFLPFFPMLPAQVLLNNFIYDVSQLSISTDNVDLDEVKKSSRWNLKFIREYMVVFGIVSSIFDFLTFYLLFSIFKLSEGGFQTGWFIESLATQALVVYVIRTKKIPFLESRPSYWLFGTVALSVVAAWAIPFISIGRIFNLEPLSLISTLSIAAIVFIYLLVVQAIKSWFFRRHLT